jgi:CheY-like chemotaxis protein
MAHILVVDDDVLVAKMFQDFLKAVGHRVTLAYDGMAALGLVNDADPIDAVITDLSMPAMSGRVMLEYLRERQSHLPAIVMSGCIEDLSYCCPLTIEFVKPVNFSLLNQRLGELLMETTGMDCSYADLQVHA